MNGPVIQFNLGPTVFSALPESRWCETRFADGTTVPAVPHDTEEYRHTALAHGYGSDTWRMCVEHELLHSLLARAKGLDVSPTLWAVAHDEEPTDQHRYEESEVLDFQRKLNIARGR